ncbi:hypothetical protein KSS87_020758, partial [Heliosperma pusillum]
MKYDDMKADSLFYFVSHFLFHYLFFCENNYQLYL